MTSPDATPIHGRSLRSTISSSGELRLELVERDVPEPGEREVVVAVEASPINPSDLGVLLGAVAAGTLRFDGSDLVGRVPEAALPLYRDRLDKPLPVGNEGAGTVVAAGPEAAALIGRRVALFGGSMWADYRVADAAAVVELPDDVSTAEGAALFINPLTALSMVETMRAEGHTALIHTAAASNLGQMLVRICAADGIGLVNIVRRAEQTQLLRDLGAVHVVDSSQPDFAERLTEAIRETGATLAFDAIGGGSLAGEILAAMERAQPPLTSYTPYGTTVPKQVYIYGSLDFSPTVIHRTFGLTWSLGGYLLTNALARLGGEAIGRMRARIVAEAQTTFASGYAQTIGLGDVLQPEVLAVFARRSPSRRRRGASGHRRRRLPRDQVARSRAARGVRHVRVPSGPPSGRDHARAKHLSGELRTGSYDGSRDPVARDHGQLRQHRNMRSAPRPDLRLDKSHA